MESEGLRECHKKKIKKRRQEKRNKGVTAGGVFNVFIVYAFNDKKKKALIIGNSRRITVVLHEASMNSAFCVYVYTCYRFVRLSIFVNFSPYDIREPRPCL